MKNMPQTKNSQSIPSWVLNLIIPVALLVFSGILTYNTRQTSGTAKMLENAEKISEVRVQLDKDNAMLRSEFNEKISTVERRYDEHFTSVERRIEPLEQSRIAMAEMMAEIKSDLKYIREQIDSKKPVVK